MRTLLVGLFLFILPSFAFAQESYTVYKLPLGRRVVTAQDTYQCYNLGEYKTLLLLDEDLRAGDELIEDGKKALEELASQKTLFTQRVKLAEEESSKLSIRLDEKQKALEDLAVKFEEQNKRLIRMRKFVLYTVSGAVILIGGTAFGVWISNAH
jgi:hypothetical protein